MHWRSVFSVCLLAAAPSAVFAQEDQPQQTPRPLAPGVMKTVPSPVEEEDTFTAPGPLEEATAFPVELEKPDWTPNYAAKTNTLASKSDGITLRHKAWGLEFSFKPVRMMYVDVPQPSGNMQRKLIWYMLYKVTNTGGHLRPQQQEDGAYTTESVTEPVRFFPQFVLKGEVEPQEGEYSDLERDEDGYVALEYLDRVIPSAVKAIQERERPGVKLHNSVEITQTPIAVSDEANDNSVWGVATWEDVNPQIDYFSVFVEGLTNAHRVSSSGDGGGQVEHKTLQVNFWRPGDEVREHEAEIRYGVPRHELPSEQERILRRYDYGGEPLPTPLDYRWVYQ